MRSGKDINVNSFLVMHCGLCGWSLFESASSSDKSEKRKQVIPSIAFNSFKSFHGFLEGFFLSGFARRARSPQQHMLITVGSYFLNPPSQEYPEEIHNVQQSVDSYSFHMRTT